MKKQDKSNSTGERKMPSPPDFLLKRLQPEITTWDAVVTEGNPPETRVPLVDLDSTAIADLMATLPSQQLPQSFEEAAPPKPSQKFTVDLSPASRHAVDYMAFQHAVEERVSAETGYAEIYTKYLELTQFNERVLRTLRRYRACKTKIREVYDRAKKGDEHLRNNFIIIQRNMVATEKALSDLQIENESLRISLSSHEEAYKGSLAQLGIQQAETANIQTQFQALATEFDNRGILLDEADRKIRAQLFQVEQLSGSLRELRAKFDTIRDENVILQNKTRETELREAGVSTLNEELAQAVTRSQKQIRELEDKLKYQSENAAQRILVLEQEVDRLRENRRAEILVDQSRRMQKTGEMPEAMGQDGTMELTHERPNQQSGLEHRPKAKPATPPPIPQSGNERTRKQWDEFYHRWSHIIDGLTSHSVPIDRPIQLKNENPESQLISEAGDLEIL